MFASGEFLRTCIALTIVVRIELNIFQCFYLFIFL